MQKFSKIDWGYTGYVQVVFHSLVYENKNDEPTPRDIYYTNEYDVRSIRIHRMMLKNALKVYYY